MTASNTRKIALVTGAGSGIGRATANMLLADGFCVVLAGRRPELLAEMVETAKAAGQEALAVVTDVRDASSVDGLFSKIESTYGRLDLLFNNAGVNAPAVPMDELPVETWKNLIDTNVTGVYLCARAAFGLMRRQSPQGGRIINNGSISAHTPRPFTSPYTASKHAVLGLTKSIALDGREFGIVCSQIDIGNAGVDMGGKPPKAALQANGDMVLEPRMDYKHVADAVVYMSSLPLEANVQFMTVMATNMPFIGRG